jgi:hypothetical protein
MLFGLFSPKSPLAIHEKTWTEVRMRWLAGQFGLDRLLRAEVVLPDEQWFPESYEGTPEDARRFLDRIARFMQINPSSVQLEIHEDEEMPGVAGQYQPGLIRLAAGLLDDPPALVAVLAHELAHDLLSGRGTLKDDLDAEWVTDLLPAYLGLGVFTANATLREKTERYGRSRWWSIQRHGYLNSCTIGYALALFAWVREERNPEWARFLRLDAAESFATGLRFLEATEDSVFTPETASSADRPTPWHTLLEQIDGRSASACVAALWGLARHPRDGRRDLGQAVPLVQRRLSDRSAAIRAEAARALATLGPAAEPVLDDLVQLLDDADPDVQIAAVYALGRLAMQPDTVLPHLVEALDDRELIRPAAVAIAAYGPAARAVVPRLASALLQALAETEYPNVDALAQAIEATAPDPAAVLRRVLEDCDAESRPPAEQILAQRHPVPTGAHAPGAWFGERRE